VVLEQSYPTDSEALTSVSEELAVSAIKLVVANSYEMFMTAYQTAECHIEGYDLNCHHCISEIS